MGQFSRLFEAPEAEPATLRSLIMANSKKPPVAMSTKSAPAKPAPVSAVPAKPVAVVAPVAAPVVAKPAPVAAPVAAAKVEAPKVEVVKPVPAKVEPVKVEPVKAEAPKPVAPVVAKVAAPVATKPVEAAKPAVVAKPAIAAKPVVAPKAVEAAPKQAPKAAAKAAQGFPVADVLKPVAALQENVRANTEKALTEFRGRYAEVKGFAETATTRLEDSMKAAQSGSREFGAALFEIVKAQTHANLDHAKTLAGAKTLPDLMKAQQQFVLSQFQSAQTRTKDVAELAGKIATNVTSPLRASFELMLRR